MTTPRAQGRLSPSRMNDFLGCEYRTWIDLERAAGRIELDAVPRPDAELILERGRRHEQRFLERLEADGHDVLRLDCDDPADQAALTREAMRAGRGVIHQACFLHGGWLGYADFLVRIDEPAAEWPWSYEVHDAKLARHPKPNYIFQLLFYTEQVERIQGTRPRRMHLILGDGEQPPFAPEDFDAYAAQVRAHFLERRDELAGGARPAYPYPVADCDFCPWWRHCVDKRRADDHLSGVAQLQRRQGLRLEQAGVHTVAAVASLPPGANVPRLAPSTLDNLRRQADLQVRSRGRAVPLHELRGFEHGRGFARLPAPSAGDVFFDFEGDPYWGDDGLEYLFGSVFRDGGRWRYQALWAHDEDGERRAFEQWVRWTTDRLAAHPDMHVFHFNHYEPTALKRLMSRYGSCEHEVDELLRRQVFVDLYTVVRQAMRVGTESYGLKAIEALYEFKRAPELTGGAGAARTYEGWRETGDPEALPRIAAYNEDDCRSTLALRDWLLCRRDAAGFDLEAIGPIEQREQTDEQRAQAQRRDALREALAGDDAAWQRMADLLDYHRREEKPQWWAFFARLAMTPEELCDEDGEAIGCLQRAHELVGVPAAVPAAAVEALARQPARPRDRQERERRRDRRRPRAGLAPAREAPRRRAAVARDRSRPPVHHLRAVGRARGGGRAHPRPRPRAERGRRPADRRPAPDARGRAAARARPGRPRRAGRAGGRARRLGAVRPGPARNRQDVHGRSPRRSADAPRPARRRRGHFTQGDREPAGRDRGGRRSVRGRQEVVRGQPREPLRQRPDPLRGPDGRDRRRLRRPDRRHRMAVVGRCDTRRGRRAVRRRGRPSLARRRDRDVAGRAQRRPARRSSAARARVAGNASTRLRALGAGAPAGRTQHRAARSRRPARDDVADAPCGVRVRVANDVRRPAASHPRLRDPGRRLRRPVRRRAADARRAARGQPPDRVGGGRADRGRARRAAGRRTLAGPARRLARADPRRHPRGGALQRAGAVSEGAAAGRRPRRHGRQVPGPAGAGRVLLDDELERRGHPAGHGLLVQPQPPERGGVARASALRGRLLTAAEAHALHERRADAARQHALPLRRERGRY